MIPANQLRLGNFVFIKWSKEFRKIDCLDIRDIAENRNYIQEQVEPISLSPDILEKWCGFEYDKITYSKGVLMLAEGTVGFDAWVGNFTQGRIKGLRVTTLHQLQNLYFSLTGQELEITLPTEQKAINEP